jgi:hypothetical protein
LSPCMTAHKAEHMVGLKDCGGGYKIPTLAGTNLPPPPPPHIQNLNVGAPGDEARLPLRFGIHLSCNSLFIVLVNFAQDV